jgi:2-polyprenyl-3-methyl-5-hydroxy-6-metoxy-1,4-benzoquinol methylase
MSLQADERDTYATMWSGVADYATTAPGERYVPLFLQVTGSSRGTVLDAGTGSGKGAVALSAAGFTPTLCDITPEGLIEDARSLRFVETCLWHDLRSFAPVFGRKWDWVYCTDVLEHIPPQFTMLVVSRLLEVARKGLFLTISTEPDVFGLWIGKPLHQTVQPYEWWRASLSELGDVTDARDLLNAAMFAVKPR